ncbi:MAG: DNA mismatch repair protein, partial [Treponema sp. GWB1_62_6]
GGGALRTEVSDDGSGMAKEDLEICWLPHATSKITGVEDLQTVETLGFRGEALSAISAVARLEIATSRDGGEAWKLAVGPAGSPEGEARVERVNRAKGTTIRVAGLFDSIPARKKFLKREAAEAVLCRQALVDKALAFPETEFRYVQDGELRLFLPAVPTRRERFCAALLGDAEARFVHEIFATGEGFSLSVVVGGSEIHRGDRRLQYVIANGRRIQDFSLLQALEYGTQGWFPNGSRPVGAVYVDIDPGLADFNIHPAKREVRFKDAPAIHRATVRALADFVRRENLGGGSAGHDGAGTTERGYGFPELRENDGPQVLPQAWPAALSDRAGPSYADAMRPQAEIRSGRLAMEALLDERPRFAPLPRPAVPAGDSAAGSARYLGTAFGLFLVAQKDDRLYLIDQHAAHERVIYDRLRARKPVVQELLVPYPFATESEEEDSFLAERSPELAELGILIKREGHGTWLLEGVPDAWKADESETVRSILDLGSSREGMADRWYATMACSAAAKDGDALDDGTAAALAQAAFDLPIPRCPHGRPVWMEITLDELLRAVRRKE